MNVYNGDLLQGTGLANTKRLFVIVLAATFLSIGVATFFVKDAESLNGVRRQFCNPSQFLFPLRILG